MEKADTEDAVCSALEVEAAGEQLRKYGWNFLSGSYSFVAKGAASTSRCRDPGAYLFRVAGNNEKQLKANTNHLILVGFFLLGVSTRQLPTLISN